ncbi:tRNA threonylcarbamoyl adenosine modification protein, Sua5/YciO/YrdC/YwlC family [Belliella buryatensis]|uniref:tRNA threonylcarbamoyl adenosine modification protein, Sua5/YciO/YrdC/YwlC family n=1 Tax=Belliella buryatensis TaxID=1500549 RepID=A0A239F4I0_9BACT|nr:L-threonylcarbamoyladenylate synthase [Belliella buryatensis]SNS51631.1 tRNA threonylcarbamoyl adenosine modification protein, Sua5/YciO/YrdC/YwlC family [Belliella buryatensis]
MAAELIKLYPENPEMKKIEHIVNVLRNGGIIIYPTDTVYGMGCDIHNQRAVERICQIKGIKPKKHNFSFICYDLSNISEYTRALNTPVFKMMKKALPGPYTFILEANNSVPKILNSNKKTVGIRVPDHSIPRLLVKELGQPILTTSIRDEDDVIEYSTDPELIFEKYQHLVDIVIDGGYGNNVASTVIDCSGEEIEVIREGLGSIDEIL